VERARAKERAKDIAARARRRRELEDIRHQQNIEAIILRAADQLPPDEGVADNQPDPDWVNDFYEGSKNVSNEQMQDLLSKILAGEVAQPGSFCRRTLNVVRSLGEPELASFARVCSWAWRLKPGESVLVPVDRTPTAAVRSGELGECPPYADLLECISLGLVHDSASFLLQSPGALSFNGRERSLAPGKSVEITGYPLTRSGVELYCIVPIKPPMGAYCFWLSHWRAVLEPHEDTPPQVPILPHGGAIGKAKDETLYRATNDAGTAAMFWHRILRPAMDTGISGIEPFPADQLKRAVDVYNRGASEIKRRDPSSDFPLIDTTSESPR